MESKTTLGKVISERRHALGFTLLSLSGNVRKKESGLCVSKQYIHDIERDRRTPSMHVLGELAKALGVDAHYLAAVAGQPLVEVVDYLKQNREAAPAVAAMFTRARAAGFDAWDEVDFPKRAALAR